MQCHQVRANHLAEMDTARLNTMDGHGLFGKLSLDGMDEARDKPEMLQLCLNIWSGTTLHCLKNICDWGQLAGMDLSKGLQ